jgi:hypothetical protein
VEDRAERQRLAVLIAWRNAAEPRSGPGLNNLARDPNQNQVRDPHHNPATMRTKIPHAIRTHIWTTILTKI